MLVFTALGHIIYQKRSPDSMVSWMIFIIFMPYIAVPLYFVIGIRKRESKHKKEFVQFPDIKAYEHYYVSPSVYATQSIVMKNGIPAASRGNRFELISDSVHAYERMMQHISMARESIEIATYIFSYDSMTATMIEALSQKAKEGVKVRLMLDTVGSYRIWMNKRRLKTLEDAGGEVAFFVPILERPFQSYINLRNHRKIYLFDQRTLLSGGMNLTNEYMGPDKSNQRWKDLLYSLEGPAVQHFRSIFRNDWVYATGKTIEPNTEKTDHFEGEDVVQVVPSGPDISTDALYEALLNAIYSARHRIWIVTPYFIPDDNITQALKVASHKGIDVKLITTKESDHLCIDAVRSSYMRDLYANGIDIVLYDDEMLHAKAMLIDENWGMVGSLNLDNRSLFLNYEAVTLVYSPATLKALETWMEELMVHALRGLKEPSKTREAIENIMKVFAPMI